MLPSACFLFSDAVMIPGYFTVTIHYAKTIHYCYRAQKVEKIDGPALSPNINPIDNL